MISIMKSWRVLASLTFCAVASWSLAWIDTGHMVVSAVAEPLLSPAAKVQVEELLQIGGDEKTRDFWSAAAWADDYKTKENGPWHYINLHFTADGKPGKNMALAENVVWAIRKFTPILADKTKPAAERADALRFLIHFVGDIHQPMHNVAQDTEKFPEGDRGGNDFRVISPVGMDHAPRNIHFLWDIGGGLYPTVKRPMDSTGRKKIRDLAEQLRTLYPTSQYALKLVLIDPQAWSDESYALAINAAYALPENSTPTPEYLAKCQQVSGERTALAGYRLADLLNRVLR